MKGRGIMHRRMKRLLLPGALLVFGGLAVGLAFAAIPGPNGVIQGCYDNGGNLRVVDALPCSKGWKPLPWNQQGIQGVQGVKGDTGIQGIQGVKGDTGAKGDTGTSGLGVAYTNYGEDVLRDIGEGLTQTVASVTLPTGAYTLMARAYVIADGDETRFGQCYFAPEGVPYVNGSRALAYVANGNAPSLLVLGDVTVTSPSLPVFLRCTGIDGPIKALGAIIATQVTAITPSE
jgi:hypothetical protein